MKYRLLKKITALEIGSKIIASVSGEIYKPNNDSYIGIPKELVENNPTWFAPIDERWRPEDGEKYYFFYSDTSLISSIFRQHQDLSQNHYYFGNCFKTEAEAQSAALKVKELLLSIHEENQ